MKHLRVKQTAQETTTALDINKVSNYVESNELDASSTIEGSLNTDYVFQESQAVLSRFPDLTITPQEGVFIRDYLMRSSNEPLVKAFAESGITTDFDNQQFKEGYVRLGAIENTDAQRIYFGNIFNFSNPSQGRIEAVAEIVENVELGGIISLSSGGYGAESICTSTENVYKYVFSKNSFVSTKPITDGVHTYTIGNNLTVDGDIIKTSSGNIPKPHYGIFFTAYQGNSVTLGGCAKMRLFSYKVIDGGEVVIADMIPCMELSSGKNGLYDVISNTFYPSANTAQNFKGIPIVPTQYTSHDIIHAIGDFVSKNNLDLTTFKSLTYNVLEAMVRIGKIDVEGCANLADVFDVSGLNALAEVNLKGTAVTQFKAENCPNLEKVSLEAPTELVIKNCPKMDFGGAAREDTGERIQVRFKDLYDVLEYIEFSEWRCAIRTGYTLTTDEVKADIVFEIDPPFPKIQGYPGYTIRCILFGCSRSTSPKNFFMTVGTSYSYTYIGDAGGWYAQNPLKKFAKQSAGIEVTGGAAYAYVDATRYTRASSGAVVNKTEEVYVGWANGFSGTAGDDDNFVGKIFSFKLADNNVLVRDMIPVFNKQTNEVGMYDRVTDSFFGNPFGGVILPGPIVESELDDTLVGEAPAYRITAQSISLETQKDLVEGEFSGQNNNNLSFATQLI